MGGPRHHHSKLNTIQYSDEFERICGKTKQRKDLTKTLYLRAKASVQSVATYRLLQ